MDTLFALVALWSLPLNANDPPPVELEPMVVVATRTPRPVDDVAGLVTVIDAGRLDAEQVRSIGDLTRYEVGISTESAGTRFGIDGFNIRGIGGNRVAIEVDGVPLGDHFDIGSFASAGRALIDPELVQRVEILRGPASTLYGSDAIGGIAAFFTWNPADLLHRSGDDRFYRLRGGYHGADDSTFASALAATGGESASLLASLVYREGAELDNSVDAPARDRVDARQYAGFGKLVVPTGDTGQLTLTAAATHQQRESDLRSFLGTGRFRSTTLLTGDDEQRRDRLTAEYRFGAIGAWVEEGALRLYQQATQTDQFTIEERAAQDTRRQRWFRYDQDTLGLEAELFRRFSALGAEHRLGYGIDLQQTDTEELRDALATDRAGAAATRTILGEVFPVRDFPNSRTEEAALWIQDEISWDRLTLIPALRYEHYRLEPSPDAVYRADHPNLSVVSVSADELTPRLGLLYELGERTTAFGQYARGFRAPPFEDANIGLDIPLFNIRAIPNPDLVPETSDGFELGIRHRGERYRLELAAFYNAYDDFIETKVNLGPDPETGTLIFQSRNITDAEMHGVELRYEQRLDRWLDGLAYHGSAFWADGEDRATGQALAGLDPAGAVAGLRWVSGDRRWRIDAIVHATGSKDDLDADDQFIPGGYGVFDLLAAWRPQPDLKLGLGLFNAFDRDYWQWQDVRGLAPGDPTLPLLSRPGRHLAATLEIVW